MLKVKSAKIVHISQGPRMHKINWGQIYDKNNKNKAKKELDTKWPHGGMAERNLEASSIHGFSLNFVSQKRLSSIKSGL